jgi:dihydroneopterin aldolase
MNEHHSSCIRLVNVVFYAHHGVNREEHKIGGKYEVDAEMSFDYREAAGQDDIRKTVDYQLVYQKIKEVLTQKKYFLIEAVAHDIACGLMHDFPILDRISIRVRKRNPPVGGVCDYAEADYTVQRG